MLPEGRVAKGYLRSEAGEGNFILHKILPGDTVYELSKRYNVPVHLIAAWNDINDISRIRAGQQLVLYVRNSENRVADLGAASDPVKPTIQASNKKTAKDEVKTRKVQVELAAVREDLLKEDSGRYYVVKEGDSLWDIARKFSLGPKDLQKLNGLATNIIHPGDRVLVSLSQPVENRAAENQAAETRSVASLPNKAEFYYHVRNGDSLWTIARKYNVSPGQIRAWNNLRSDLIHPGNKLLLMAAYTGEPGADTFYLVRSGDSLWTIARRHNISPEEIKKWNNLRDNTIYPGNRLLLKLASDG
jgi:LysM repeat protein